MVDSFREDPGDQERSGPDRIGSQSGAGTESLFGAVRTVCMAAVRLTGVDGAALALLGTSAQVRDLVYATDALAQQVDELQFVVGEGPCLQAHRQGRREVWPDLEDPAASDRWPAFTAEVLELGVRALFAFPVPGEGGSVGVLELYRGTVGALSTTETESGDACAAAVGHALHVEWDRRLHEAGDVETAVATAVATGGFDGDDGFSRAVVFNAAGMVAVQLAVTTNEALTRVRAYSYSQGRPITEVAADIVARKLSLREARDSSEGQR